MPDSRRRFRESDLVLPALRFAEENGGTIGTSELIEDLVGLFQPSGEDAAILENRQDSKFTQIVRNLVSHRDSRTSFIHNGYAEYTGNGIRITDEGRKLLRQLNYTLEREA